MTSLASRLRRLVRPPASAVVIPVSEAAGVAEMGAPGMPPHVTVLWPFARRLGRRHRRGLAAIAARHVEFEFALTRIGEFPNAVYLAPEPTEPFVELVRAIAAQWPRHQPYDGAYNDVVPHLTIRLGSSSIADDERSRIEAALPIPCTARELMLLAPAGDGWREVYRAPLGPAPSSKTASPA